MINNSQFLGIRGEEIAKRHLVQNGYEILETNWRFKKLEVDIIARRLSEIVFVEVKTRSSEAFGEPETAVTMKKQKFLVAAAHQYLTENEIDAESRFDVVTVLQVNGRTEIIQVEGAFYPVAP